MKQSTGNPRFVSKAQVAQDVLPFVSKLEHTLPLLGMLAQAQLSIEPRFSISPPVERDWRRI